MLRLPDQHLPAAAMRGLQKFQKEIDAIPEYERRVETAKAKFKSRNTVNSATFGQVRNTLTAMCSGVQRCGYCEDSAAVEIDHHRPKTLYPEMTFVWENYVYSCGGCNRPKSDNYAVFLDSTGELQSVARPASSPIVPPASGDMVLIDPRHENPLEFMRLDLLNTFRFRPIGLPESRNYQRAEYTIATLQLNTRSYLPPAREQAYQGYLSHLHRYIRWRDMEQYAERINEPIQAILHDSHPTVWAEMKRQRLLIIDLKTLFEQAPEALNW